MWCSNAVITKGMTMMHTAIRDGKVDLVEALLKKGVKINGDESCDDYQYNGYKPLHLSIEYRNVQITKLLISKGADVNARTKISRRTPLLLLMEGFGSGGEVEEHFKYITKTSFPDSKKVSVNGKYKALIPGNSISERIVHNIEKVNLQGSSSDENDEPNDVNNEIGNAIDGRPPSSSNEPNNKNSIPEGSDHDVCKLLFKVSEPQSGDSRNITHIRGENRINKYKDNNLGSDYVVKTLAEIILDGMQICSFLIQKGCDVNVRGSRGNAPIHFAAFSNVRRLVGILISAGADVTSVNARGLSPLHIICSLRQADIEIVRILIEHGCDVNLRSYEGFTPLHFASSKSTEVVKMLLRCNADPSVSGPSEKTMLHFACRSSYRSSLDNVRLLMKHCDVNAKDVSGQTALHVATIFKRCDLIDELIKSGASTDVVDDRGVSPLHIACLVACLGGVEILLKAGCEVDPRNMLRHTPLMYAVMGQWSEIVETLFVYGADLNSLSRFPFPEWNTVEEDWPDTQNAFNTEIGVSLAKQIVLRRSANKRVSKLLYTLVTAKLYKMAVLACKAEIHRMKEITITDTIHSIFDLITKSQDQLVSIFRRCDYRNVVEFDFKKRTPIYARYLKVRFEDALKRMSLTDNCIRLAPNTLDGTASFSGVTISFLLGYLSNNNLKMLTTAFTSTNTDE